MTDVALNELNIGGKSSLSKVDSRGAVALDAVPEVSVIIPAYNMAAYISVAIISVLQQTLSNIEVLIIDDGSSDATLEVANQIANADPRVRVIALDRNRGKSVCMNVGMAQARGKWIAILDADDWYAPTRIESLIAAAERAQVTMVADNLAVIDIHARSCVGTLFPQRGGNFKINLHDHLKESDITTVFGGYGMLKPIICAEFVKNNNLQYYEPALFSQDFYFLLSYFVAGGECLVVDQPFYYYSQPFGFISHKSSRPERSRYRYEVLEAVHAYFEDLYCDRFSQLEQEWMKRRGRGIKRMISFHQIRDSVQKRDMRGVCSKIYGAGLTIWPLLLKKMASLLFREIKFRYRFMFRERSVKSNYFYPKDF